MAKRWVTLHIEVDDEDYAEAANAVWMLLQLSRLKALVEHDGLTSKAVLNDWWQVSVDRRKWS
jgi:hypothetical protein